MFLFVSFSNRMKDMCKQMNLCVAGPSTPLPLARDGRLLARESRGARRRGNSTRLFFSCPNGPAFRTGRRGYRTCVPLRRRREEEAEQRRRRPATGCSVRPPVVRSLRLGVLRRWLLRRTVVGGGSMRSAAAAYRTRHHADGGGGRRVDAVDGLTASRLDAGGSPVVDASRP